MVVATMEMVQVVKVEQMVKVEQVVKVAKMVEEWLVVVDLRPPRHPPRCRPPSRQVE